jgi:hypothetical protein
MRADPARGYIDAMPEPIVQSTIDIAAPAEIIFDILADPAQHPKIDGSTTVRRLRGSPRRLSAGSKFSMSMRLFGVPYRVTNRVVEFELNRLIAWRTLSPSAGGTNWGPRPEVPRSGSHSTTPGTPRPGGGSSGSLAGLNVTSA